MIPNLTYEVYACLERSDIEPPVLGRPFQPAFLIDHPVLMSARDKHALIAQPVPSRKHEHPAAPITNTLAWLAHLLLEFR